MTQIATSMGHLELSRFLLDQSSYLRDDTVMLSALQHFISGSSGRIETFKLARQQADNVYDLFLDSYGLVLPMTEEEHHNPTFTEDAQSNMLLTTNSLRKIRAGQFTTVHDRAFEYKFPMAMRSIGWPAESLIDFLQPCNASQLVTAQDPQARTALHWTAKHFGYWAGVWQTRDICPDDAKAISYAKLATKLLKMGSDAHAVNNLHETPFMTMIHQFMTFAYWPTCATIVRRWGEILVEAGLDLNEYVQVENPLLRCLADKRRDWDGRTYYSLHPAETQLTVLHDLSLAVQITFCRPLSIWEQRIPPGAWDGDSRLPTSSINAPPRVGNDELYWRKVKTVKMYSAPYLIQATSQAERPFYSSTDFEENWAALLTGVQDDHGIVATTVSRGRARKHAGSSAAIARAASVPPEMTQPIYNELPTDSSYGLMIYTGWEHWFAFAYRCPIELSWKLSGGASSNFLGDCVELPRMLVDFESRAIEKRLRAKDDWEVQLLREQGDLDNVKGFAERYFPGLKDLVEKELELARLIQDLG
jgi:hypothetical protein